jgi:branched-chain amino acid transport system permease protein
MWVSYLGLALTALLALSGAGAMIEMIYHIQLNAAMGPELKFAGVMLNVESLNCWVGSAFVMLTGIGLFEVTRRQFAHEWDEAQVFIEKEIKRREAL